jgi:hypothetical protein
MEEEEGRGGVIRREIMKKEKGEVGWKGMCVA